MGHENGGWMNDDQRGEMKERARKYQENHGKYQKPEISGNDIADEIEAERVMAVSAQAAPGPQTHEEAHQFHEGFLAGATAYAAAVGHSTLKSGNPKLCEVFDKQGWRTIETFEKLAAIPVVCEHGIPDGDWCEPCNREYKRAAAEEDDRENIAPGDHRYYEPPGAKGD